MAFKDKSKLIYKCPEKLWAEIKRFNAILDNGTDVSKTIDELTKRGIKSLKDEKGY